ncbi:MAG: putative oxidoreductase [Myxococcales bacterium]|nr:putative oxidoreductase [Myxococcales bacterium]
MAAIGVGVVGVGPWGLNLARAFARARGARLVAIADLDGERLARAGNAHADVRLTNDVEQLLATAGVDAVAVAVDSPRHEEVARRALVAGRHVLVEKPMALSVAAGEGLVDLAARERLVLMVGHVLLHHAGIARARALIAAGELGRVLYLQATRVGFGTVRPAESAWWSVAPHDVAVALDLFGAVPATVSATGAGYLRADAPDVAFGTLRFDDGRLAQLHVSWLAPEKQRALTVVGSKKMLTFDEADREHPLRLFDRAFAPHPTSSGFVRCIGDVDAPDVVAAEPLLTECEHFVESIARGTRPRGDGASALDVLRVLEAGDRSMHAGGAPSAVATPQTTLDPPR